jgi:small-conductance mechanosensitive channel
MRSRLSDPWIPIDRIDALVQLEPAIVILGLASAAWLVYKLFLKDISVERHRNLRSLFSNLIVHIALMALLFAGFVGIRNTPASLTALERIAPYFGMLTLFSGATVFIKTARIIAFEYLFIGHMRVGVPVLLVNLFTLVLSLFLTGWFLTEIFNIRLAPLLATSAIFSIILGLALQDTLGNLFAGISLQFDKPYEIGDWIEVQNLSQKWAGKVQEISWRATVLIGMEDEILTIPNRVVAQSEVSNFSTKRRPFIRSQVFRIPFGVSIQPIKEILTETASAISSIRKFPKPIVLLTETTESWMTFKVIYFIEDYGSQVIIADQVITYSLDALARAGIPLASSRLTVIAKQGPSAAHTPPA